MKTITTIILIFITFVSYSQQGKTYHVTSSTLNLRQKANTNSKVVDKLSLYDNVVIVDSASQLGWLRVIAKNKEGFVYGQYIAKGKCVVSIYEVRTGAVCRDGSTSNATGRGACSHHGGVNYWLTRANKSISIIED